MIIKNNMAASTQTYLLGKNIYLALTQDLLEILPEHQLDLSDALLHY